MHSNDGHGIQPHITFHFQLFALFLRISSVCGRVSVSLYPIKQLVGLSLAPRAYEESPGNTERPTS